MKKTRIQFELSVKSLKKLEDLMEEIEITTKKDLINNALTFLMWAVDEKKHGRTIASVDQDENKYKEIIMPFMAHIHR